MREILFRGKRIDNGEWVYGNFVMDATEQVQREKIPLDPILADGFIRRYDLAQQKIVMHEVDRKTVGQYTGLTDKNGTKIFEGDICKNTENGKTAVVKWYEEYNADMLYCKSENHVYWLFDVDFAKIEIIGNIHDNPELMGGNENE